MHFGLLISLIYLRAAASWLGSAWPPTILPITVQAWSGYRYRAAPLGHCPQRYTRRYRKWRLSASWTFNLTGQRARRVVSWSGQFRCNDGLPGNSEQFWWAVKRRCWKVDTDGTLGASSRWLWNFIGECEPGELPVRCGWAELCLLLPSLNQLVAEQRSAESPTLWVCLWWSTSWNIIAENASLLRLSIQMFAEILYDTESQWTLVGKWRAWLVLNNGGGSGFCESDQNTDKLWCQ